MDETDADSVSKADLSDKDDEYEEKVGGGGRRIFSPEDGELIGGSFALPAWVFVITRILFSGFHFSLGTTVLVSANVLIGKLSGYKWLYRLAGGVHVIMGTSFLVLAIASFRYFRATRSTSSRTSISSTSSNSSSPPTSIINYIASPIHHTGVSLATTLSVMSTIYIYCGKSTSGNSGGIVNVKNFGVVSRMVLNPLLGTAYSVAGTSSMLDFMLGARIRFRKEYIPLPPLVLLIFFASIGNKSFSLPHAVRFMEKENRLGLWLLALHLVCAVIAAVAVPMTYIGGWIEPRLNKLWEEYKEAIENQDSNA